MKNFNSATTSRQFADYEADIIQGLIARQPLMGPGGLLSGLIKHVVEGALRAELDTQLAEQRAAGVENKRNGRTKKTIRTDLGPVEIESSRDRAGTFEPVTVGKRQYDLAPHLAKQIVTLYARGNSERDIAAQLHDLLGNDLSAASICAIIQEEWPRVQEWQQRPLQAFYAVIYCDAIHFNLRQDGSTDSAAVYTIYGIDAHGQRDILAVELSEGGEGASQWSVCLQSLKQRGVEDVLVVCAHGLAGFAEAVNHHFPQSVFQRCLVHIIRNCMRHVDYKDRRPLCADLRSVYQATSRLQGQQALEEARLRWSKKYPHVFRIWDTNWEDIMAFKDFGPELQRIVYTTNPVENVHRLERKATKTKGSWPSAKSLLIQLFLALDINRKGWYRQVYNWVAVSRELAQKFGDRFTKHLVV